MIKLIALDLDGTLLNQDKTISSRNRKALLKAHQQGVEIVLASGRPQVGIKPVWDALQLGATQKYSISFNGALVKNLDSNTTLMSKGFFGADAKKLKSIADELGLDIHAFSEVHGVITPRLNPYTEHEATVNGVPVTEFDFDELEDDHPIIKVLMVAEPKLLSAGIDKLPSELKQHYTCVQSAPFFYEFLNPAVNKGVGVEAIAKDMGIDMSEVVSFGDAGNDAAMLKMAGLGVAMGNADDETKALADRVTLSNEEDGVAAVIEELLGL